MDERENHSENHEHHRHHEHSSEHIHTSKRRLWKEAKKKHNDARREYYRNAPWIVRAWKFWLGKVVFALIVLAIAGVAFLKSGLAVQLLKSYVERVRDNPVSKETIYKMSPLDEDGANRIDLLEPLGEDNSWTICVYMVGSSLEDCGENDLSYLTRVITEPQKEQNRAQNNEHLLGLLNTFIMELADKQLDMPEYLYRPEEPVASSTAVTEDVIVADETGAASADIKEITSGVWGDNITIVIQTGGATRWSNSMVNPNRTQRFEYKSGVFSKVAELPLQDSCAPETLSDFMRFCDKEYPSDHRMLILWDHGAGVAGYGHDSIFGTHLSLKQLRQAFESVYKPNLSDTPYDILGFDACLMATAEVAYNFDGYAEYLVASEELEPEYGWDYGAWLQAMTDDPAMNAAQAGRAITDSYMDYYMALNKNLGKLIGSMDVTMSVVDVHKAAKAYNAYCELCASQLKDAAGDLGVLANIGRTAGSVTRYGNCYYAEVNAIDLGSYMDLLADTYPDEAQKVRTQLRDAVLYHRQSEGLIDSQGLSVYVPVETGNFDGLLDCVSFVYDVCENKNVSALYYYKIAGCLNDEMGEYVSGLTGMTPKVLNITPFRNFEYVAPVVEDGFWSVPVDETLRNMIQDCSLELASYDADTDSLTYYGMDEYVEANGEGSLVNYFEGEWAALDGVVLPTEVVSSSASSVSYRSKVKYGGDYYYLLFTYNRDSEEFTISGLKKIETGEDTILMLNSRQMETALVGKTIIPVYKVHSFETGEDSEISGKRIHVTTGSKIEMVSLPEGNYLSTIVISDPRGDNYYSGVVEQKVINGHIVSQKINTDFYGTD